MDVWTDAPRRESLAPPSSTHRPVFSSGGEPNSGSFAQGRQPRLLCDSEPRRPPLHADAPCEDSVDRITWALITGRAADAFLETDMPGTGKDGSPTVAPQLIHGAGAEVKVRGRGRSIE